MNRESVAEELHRSSLRLLRRLRKEDESFDISTARLSAISVLVFVGPQTIGALAAMEQVSQPTMTSLSQGLVKEGLVRVETDTHDRRVRRMVATAKGRRLLHRARRRRIETLTAMMGRLSVRQLKVLSESASLMESMLGETG